MWNIVWVSPQGHRSVSVSRHFLLQAPQCPCSMRKRFSRDHCCRGKSKPGCRIVGSHTRWELTTGADFQLCLHLLLMSTGCKSSHNGFLDVSCSNGELRISGWIEFELMEVSINIIYQKTSTYMRSQNWLLFTHSQHIKQCSRTFLTYSCHLLRLEPALMPDQTTHMHVKSTRPHNIQ